MPIMEYPLNKAMEIKMEKQTGKLVTIQRSI